METRQSHSDRGESKVYKQEIHNEGNLTWRGKEKSLGIPSASEPTLYYTSLQPGPLSGIPHQSWPPSALDITYYSNNATLNIRCHGRHSISTPTLRVFWGHWGRGWIRGCGVGRPLGVTVTPKTLSILTPNVVWEVHRLTAWEFCLALVELYIVHTLRHKISPWVMRFGPQGVEIWSI